MRALIRFDGWPGTVCDAMRGTPEDAITGLAVFDRPTVKRWGAAARRSSATPPAR